MRDRLDARVRKARSRALLRDWEYRQRRLAKGVWYRLRRVLADAREAYEISERDSQRLRAEGYSPEPVGAEFEPPKTILFVSAQRLEQIEGRRQIELRLGPELLAARCLALVPFDLEDSPLTIQDWKTHR